MMRRDKALEDSQLENLPEKTFKEIEIETLRSNEPVLFGLESLVDGVCECREGLAALKGMPRDQSYYSNLYKVSNSLTGLTRTLLDFSKYVSEYDKLREHAKTEIFHEVRMAFAKDEELAERVTAFIEEAVGD